MYLVKVSLAISYWIRMFMITFAVPAGRFARALTTMLGHTRARLASEVVKRTPSDPALASSQHFLEDGVDRGRHVHSIPPVLPIGFNDVAMLPQHMQDSGEAPNDDVINTPHGLQTSSDDVAQLGGDGQEISFDDLQGLLGNGNWAPWFQNSVRGCLAPCSHWLLMMLPV